MPDFLDEGIIKLIPGTSKRPVTLFFIAETSSGANDGSLPYGTLIESANITIVDSDGDDYTDEILVANSVSVSNGLNVLFEINHSTEVGVGAYTANIELTLDNIDSSVLVFLCSRFEIYQ